MRILITGSEGVLGSVLKTELRKRGHDVYGCDLQHSADAHVMRADVAERRQITRVFDEIDPEIVYHLAAEFGRKNGEEYYEQLWKTNCVGTRNVIEECSHMRSSSLPGGPMFIFASSSEAYGLSDDYAGDLPLQEGLLDRYVPKFHNEYSLSKWTNERQIHTAVRNSGLRAMILRFFNVYGPPERFSPYRSVVCQFAYKMLANDDVTVNCGGYRSHLWIGDWCHTVAGIPDRLNLLMDIKRWPGSADTPYTPVFNIGGDEYEAIKSLYERLVKIIPNHAGKVSFVDKEQANTATKQPDNAGAREWLDHYPKMDLNQGLELTVNWLKKEYGL